MEKDITLAKAGRYFVVAFDSAGQPGELSVATGREEKFSLDEIGQLPGLLQQVRVSRNQRRRTVLSAVARIGRRRIRVFKSALRAAQTMTE